MNVAKHNHNMVETRVETVSKRMRILPGRNKPIVIPVDSRLPSKRKRSRLSYPGLEITLLLNERMIESREEAVSPNKRFQNG